MGRGGRGTLTTCSHTSLKRQWDMDYASSSGSSGSSTGDGYTLHHVSKFDTLAGIAIKYGVEVADVKRMNGLTTDLQMYARKTLRIPLHGKHPPSVDSIACHGQASSSSEFQPRLGKHSYAAVCPKLDSVNTAKRKVSSSMGLLRGYYGLPGTPRNESGEGTEMEVYRSENSGYQSEDEPFTPRDKPTASKLSNGSNSNSHSSSSNNSSNPFNSMVSMARDFVVAEFEKAAVRRRSKAESPSEDSQGACRSSAERPRSSTSSIEVEVDCPTMKTLLFNPSRDAGSSTGGGGGKKLFSGEFIFNMKKSPSTPSLQEEKAYLVRRNGSKGDLSATTNAGQQRPLLDNFNRRKAAID